MRQAARGDEEGLRVHHDAGLRAAVAPQGDSAPAERDPPQVSEASVRRLWPGLSGFGAFEGHSEVATGRDCDFIWGSNISMSILNLSELTVRLLRGCVVYRATTI